ncbi:replication-associated recombination protein A [Arthrobacter bambusae]|uniref:ATPase n=1 Tax=Arthrobacter bambusae TaxID=1338426 RepID=A0AAW8DA43_9MICC|nr:replication-associated recombination protein A [Arthrobacter bambusae]MDP9903165.1 putative ATPase [Arthrobacter bambusae]MDQ0128841.1 putative ATPase [Arthrobacter bambusae]MDQ0180182.1 putative ATPase [Arthrobacter bambusae]
MTAKPPLAARMRPTSLDQVVGQDHLVFPGSPLAMIASGALPGSVVLYGPPGTGKTSIAQAIAPSATREFVELSATRDGVPAMRKIIDAAMTNTKPPIVFVDEIHRLTKAQQDVLLPPVEHGVISLIGATTENPSFSVNAALLSRSSLCVLSPLTDQSIQELLARALSDDRGYGDKVTVDDSVLAQIARLASGDARQALTRLEELVQIALAQRTNHVTETHLALQLSTGNMAIQRYDRDGDQHYDIVSAWIKSMRGSNPDAALHWLARLIEAGEDPRFIARRLVVHASEDVGMADPSVLPLAVAAAQAVQLIGMPEARLNLAHATVAIATAPKSNAVYRGISQALEDVQHGQTGEVPLHLRDAHYPGAASLGHGAGYRYPHDYPYAMIAQEYLPDNARGTRYYQPTQNGFEQQITARLSVINQVTSS